MPSDPRPLDASLAAALAHELRNLFTVQRGHVALARAATEDFSRKRHLTAIDDVVLRAEALVQRYVQLVRGDDDPNHEARGPVDLVHETRAWLELVRAQLAAHEVELVDELGAAPVMAPLGAVALGQIVLNLVQNAREAMPTGGTLRVGLAHDAHDLTQPSGSGPHEAPPEAAGFFVADTGIGMDAATQARVFTQGFTTKAHGEGLGLATVRRLVQDSGGAITVHSAPGDGARFDIRWPRR